MIATDRISAFDVILPEPIPQKGQILNRIAAFMLNMTANVCPNWLEETPAANVSVGKLCRPYKVEMVVRGNLSGYAWRAYRAGKRTLCGIDLPEGMRENDFFEEPVLTPSTKADEGHDEDISKQEIIRQGIINAEEFAIIEHYARALFKKGKEYAAKRGLILADTKYEFGKFDNQIYLMDEVHTPDSSRYFYADGFAEHLRKGTKPKQLSKEFVREWLIENHFMGKEGEQVPEMTKERIAIIRERYVELYEALLGTKFIPEFITEKETERRILAALNTKDTTP